MVYALDATADYAPTIVYVAVLGGFVALRLFFSVLKSQWPQLYWGSEASRHPLINRGLRAYLVWRFAPISTAVAASGRVLSSTEHSSRWALIVVVLHIGDTNGRALWGLARGHYPDRRIALTAFHVVTIFCVCIAGAAGYFAMEPLRGYLPTAGAISSDLWSALAAGFAGAYLMRRVSTSTPTPKLLAVSRSEISDHLWSYAESLSLWADLDPVIAHSILLVENLQRPGWVRFLERQKGRFLRPGSYGIMQMQGSHVISDEESIRLGIERIAALGPYGPNDAHRAFRDFNDNDDFVHLASEMAYELRQSPSVRRRKL
jgi:hypothetical protein